MRLIQYTTLASFVYFIIRCYFDASQEAKTCSFMAMICLGLIFIIASHYRGVQNNEISDEIIKNHVRNRNNGNSSRGVIANK